MTPTPTLAARIEHLDLARRTRGLWMPHEAEARLGDLLRNHARRLAAADALAQATHACDRFSGGRPTPEYTPGDVMNALAAYRAACEAEGEGTT